MTVVSPLYGNLVDVVDNVMTVKTQRCEDVANTVTPFLELFRSAPGNLVDKEHNQIYGRSHAHYALISPACGAAFTSSRLSLGAIHTLRTQTKYGSSRLYDQKIIVWYRCHAATFSPQRNLTTCMIVVLVHYYLVLYYFTSW